MTVRQRIIEALGESYGLTLRGLSSRCKVSEKELPAHLEHVRKSLKAKGLKLVIDPPRCLNCDFEFKGRTRFTKPSKCPECRSRDIQEPAFRVEDL